MSKLSDYLKKNKIDARRVVAASKSIEGLRPEDRAIRLTRKQTKADKDGVTDALKELAAKKMPLATRSRARRSTARWPAKS